MSLRRLSRAANSIENMLGELIDTFDLDVDFDAVASALRESNSNSTNKKKRGYYERKFTKLLRQGVREVGKHRRSIKGNGVSTYEHRRQADTNSIEQDDG